MCGIFGLVLPTGSADEIPVRALLTLGMLAEGRGIDAGGLAFWTGAEERGAGAPAAVGGRPTATVDGWQVSKRLGRFRELPRRALAAQLRGARVAMGHTRHAVQGDPFRLDNAGPWLVGPLVGTFCGDVDAAELRRRYRLTHLAGDTDAEVVFSALAAAADLPAGVEGLPVLEVLQAMPGPAALAWADRARPERVWLARGAQAPLSVAYTAGGAALWASDPEWLRDMAFSWGIRLAGEPTELPEGTLLAIEGGRQVQQAGRWQFEPIRSPGLRIAA
jgi:glutamine---fructose-6-phosphate transaminase (isomerizing)